MTAAEETVVCANCGREHPATEMDPAGWCAGCRREVVRRATIAAHGMAALAALLTLAWVVMLVQPERFVVVWMLLVGLVYFVLYKLVRRVAFEVIRGRGVTPPDSD